MLNFLPTPKSVCMHEGFFVRSPKTAITVPHALPYDAMSAVRALAEGIAAQTGLRPPYYKALQAPEGTITFAAADLPEQAYTLTVTEKGITLAASSAAGAFYAAQTLLQLLSQVGAQVPCLAIEDAPDYAERGYYWDITRGRVPTLSTMKQLVDELGTAGFSEAEERCICSLSLDNAVIATGGSVALEEKAMQHLHKSGKVAFIRLSYETVEKRLNNISTRGIAMKEGCTIEQLYEERAPLYERYADITVDCTALTPEECVDAIVEKL